MITTKLVSKYIQAKNILYQGIEVRDIIKEICTREFKKGKEKFIKPQTYLHKDILGLVTDQ